MSGDEAEPRGNVFHSLAALGQARTALKLISTSQKKVVNSGLLTKDGKGRTPLHLAAYYGHLKVLRVFIEACPEAADVRDAEGNSVRDALRRPNAAVVGDPRQQRLFQRLVRIDKKLCEHQDFGQGPMDIWDVAVSGNSLVVVVQPTWGGAASRALFAMIKDQVQQIDLGVGGEPRYVATSNVHSLAITADQCFAWGKNVNALLGFDTDEKIVTRPRPLDTPFVSSAHGHQRNVFSALEGNASAERDIKDPLIGVDCCDFHSLCYTTSKVWAWGVNRGQMVNKAGRNELVESPVKIFQSPSPLRIRSVKCCDNAVLILLSNGQIQLLCQDQATRMHLGKNAVEAEAIAASGDYAAVQTTKGRILRCIVRPRGGASADRDEVVTVWTPRRAKDEVTAFDVGDSGSIIVATKSSVFRLEEGQEIVELKMLKGMYFTAIKTDAQFRTFVGINSTLAGLPDTISRPAQEAEACYTRWGTTEYSVMPSDDELTLAVDDCTLRVHRSVLYARCPTLRPLLSGLPPAPTAPQTTHSLPRSISSSMATLGVGLAQQSEQSAYSPSSVFDPASPSMTSFSSIPSASSSSSSSSSSSLPLSSPSPSPSPFVGSTSDSDPMSVSHKDPSATECKPVAAPGGSALFKLGAPPNCLVVEGVPLESLSAFVRTIYHSNQSLTRPDVADSLQPGRALHEYNSLARLITRDLGTGLWDARLAGVGCDLVLNGTHPAHSHILASASPVLEAQLSRWTHSKVLDDPALSPGTIDDVLRYSYTRELVIPQNACSQAEQAQRLFGLWQVADELLMYSLCQECEERLFEMISFDLVIPFMEQLSTSQSSAASRLSASLRDIIVRNLSYFLKQTGELEPDMIDSLERHFKDTTGTEDVDQNLADAFDKLKLEGPVLTNSKSSKKKRTDSRLEAATFENAQSKLGSTPLTPSETRSNPSKIDAVVMSSNDSRSLHPISPSPARAESGWIKAGRRRRTSGLNEPTEKLGSPDLKTTIASGKSPSTPTLAASSTSRPSPSMWSASPTSTTNGSSASIGATPNHFSGAQLGRPGQLSPLAGSPVAVTPSKGLAGPSSASPSVGSPTSASAHEKLSALPGLGQLPRLGQSATPGKSRASSGTKTKFSKDKKSLKQFHDPAALAETLAQGPSGSPIGSTPWKQVPRASQTSDSVRQMLEQTQQLNSRRVGGRSVWGV